MTYWSILEKVPGSQLRLTKMDNEIYESFMKEFPDFNPAETINEDEMKSKAGKEKWRNWINQYEGKIDDFNFGTMLRSNPKFEYEQETTIFGELRACDRFPRVAMKIELTVRDVAMRMQFYAVEIAR